MAQEFRHIVRVVGMDVSGEKKIVRALMGVKGIGHTYANAVVHAMRIDKETKLGDLTDDKLHELEDIIKNPAKHGIPPWLRNRTRDSVTGEDVHLVTSDLDLAQREDVNRMQRIRCYRGVRHRLGLPVRGQRTRSSGRTGKTIGVVRRKLAPGQAAPAAGKKEEKK